MYSQIYKGVPASTLEKVLWGDFYFNEKTRKFMKKPTKEYPNRAFVEFILEPIYKIFSHVVSKEFESLKGVLGKAGVSIKKHEAKMDIKPLLRLVFQRFCGASHFLVDMLVEHIPTSG